MSYHLRQLPPAEWDRIRDYGHFHTGTPLPAPEHAVMLVVEEDAQIIGVWMAMNVVLLEGLYISEEYRHKSGVARRLFHGMISLLQGRGIRSALAYTPHPAVAAMAEKAGFTKVDGELYLLSVKGS